MNELGKKLQSNLDTVEYFCSCYCAGCGCDTCFCGSPELDNSVQNTGNHERLHEYVQYPQMDTLQY